MPVGRVKWFSLEKGFGFISSDEGEDVYLAASALPEGVSTVKPGTKLEFGVAEGRKGPQALSVRVIEAPPSLANSKAGADDLAVIIEESIKMLDRVEMVCAMVDIQVMQRLLALLKSCVVLLKKLKANEPFSL